ncbi:hypothetical protein PCANC_24575 [Puccinia coronata f. sp. avenae]|uniref:Uncharacterized protein n=1 Tax=Puccinia coronata f. sp. avenae TaxID=200324 RepID=A0A2N5U2X6_9BASI|nr:hypothetical protein PCANC_24575 [Puccinia coronata f. sp. avenae]
MLSTNRYREHRLAIREHQSTNNGNNRANALLADTSDWESHTLPMTGIGDWEFVPSPPTNIVSPEMRYDILPVSQVLRGPARYSQDTARAPNGPLSLFEAELTHRWYNLISWPNESPLQRTLCLALSRSHSRQTPLQIITSLYLSDSGHSTLQPGTTYAVRGDLTLLDNDDTHALQFNPGHLLPLLPSQPGKPDDAILIESVGTIQSIHYSASLTQHGIVKLAVVAHYLSRFGQNIVIEYTFCPTLFTAEFAGQLMLGHKMRVAGELVLWKPDAGLITVEAEVAEMLN